MSLHLKKIECFFSPFEPDGISRAKFHVTNIAFFVIVSLPSLFFLNKGNEKKIITEEGIWNIWLIFIALAVIHLLFTNFKQVGRFSSLVIYAQNRAIVIMFVVALFYFPFEFLLLMPREDYLSHGIKIGTMLFKIISYTYLYYLVLRLVYFFNFKKMNKTT